MAKTYTIQQGDHLSSIAEENGFLDFDTIWKHPNNAALRDKRKLPHVLLPGDQVFIPEKYLKAESCMTGRVHQFQIRVPTLKLRIALKDFDEMPMVGVACELNMNGTLFKLISNNVGVIEANIPRTSKGGILRISDLDLEYPVRVGHLDPIDENTGWHARLVNLGYNPGRLDGDDEQLRYALEEFQCDHGLAVTGELDEPTRSALAEAHGV